MVMQFANQEDLARWLAKKGIDTRSWGKGSYKSIANLWDEYLAGEVAFEECPSMRVVRVVQILLRQNGDILLEIEQEFRNGERRQRNQPPSEKIKGDENGLDAALRCLQEELELSREQIDALRVDEEREELIVDSPSYPGLPTRYTFQKIWAHVSGLPQEDFWRENKAAQEGDPVHRHLWGWRGQP